MCRTPLNKHLWCRECTETIVTWGTKSGHNGKSFLRRLRERQVDQLKPDTPIYGLDVPARHVNKRDDERKSSNASFRAEDTARLL